MIRPAIICARGGSKGIPGKNLREFYGKPLISWTIEQALRVPCIDTVVVSSDSDQILDIARHTGAQHLIKRPKEYATDTSSAHPAIAHALGELKASLTSPFDSFVLLQTTSPLREDTDIESAVSLWEYSKPGSVVSASPARHSPYYTLLEQDANGNISPCKQLKKPVSRRQDAPRCWAMNGAVYVFDRTQYIEKQRTLYEDSVIYSMTEERSIDIDSNLDWQIAEMLFGKASHSNSI